MKLFSFFLFLFFFNFNTLHAKKPLVIGSKKFTESIILSEILALLLEKKFSQKVVRKYALGGTQFVFEALLSGDIHAYPDYTGTGYVMILKKKGLKDPNKIYNLLQREYERRFQLVWSPPLGFNNTYTIAVRESDPYFKDVFYVSDLVNKVEKKKIATPHEFMERPDGFNHFIKTYGLKFSPKNILSMDSGLMYSAVRNKKADLITAYSTDGRIKAYRLKTLKDDRKFFPPYYACFLAKKKTLEQSPSLRKAFHIMKDLISEKEMIAMNKAVDKDKQEISTVAHNFLLENNLIKGKVRTTSKTDNFFHYAFTKRSYLWKIIKEHLYLCFTALFFALLLSFPLGILLTRYEFLAKTFFPVINLLQTIPSLALLGFLVPLLGIGFAPAIVALCAYALLPLVRNTYTGISKLDRKYIQISKGLGLTNGQILRYVEIPLALPFILAGIRTAAVIIIGITTLAALVGAGGLGDPIFRGLATLNSQLILLGAIPAALLAVFVDKLILKLEKGMVSPGITQEKK